jgi:hypothetical protein
MINRSVRTQKQKWRIDKRTILVIASLVTTLLVLVQAMAVTSLAVMNPFLPGNAFFPLQSWCEDAAAWVFAPGAGRAGYYLDLAEQRTYDLEERAGTRHELAALTALESALDRASAAIEISPGTQAPALWTRLLDLIQRSENTLPRLTQIPSAYAVLVIAFQTRLHTLRNMADSRSRLEPGEGPTSDAGNLVRVDASAGIAVTGGTALPGGLIPFPPGSSGAKHAFYTMTGRHTILECSSCHTAGIYRGIRNSCEDCHIEVKPVDHYSSGCVVCHNPNGWQEIVFDHLAAGAVDCQVCHGSDAPANHFSGQCSNCHGTESWQGAVFNHAGYIDCQRCHAGDAPANHFSGQCSQCHSTMGWQGAVFNHAGYTDCQRCHAGDAPANHFNGQCLQCHSTIGWPGASFNHAGYTDCQRCHAGDAPANHFSGQCSQCHSTMGWPGASFNHAGYTDCQRCHAGDAPANHYSGQCSLCHNQSNWRNASFNHSGQSDCISCHLGDRPREHDSGQCSECHNTSKWGD